MQYRITGKNDFISNLSREFFTIIRFGLVGIAATAVHLSIVLVLLTYTVVPPLIANTCAFLFAFIISFFGHYIWTFSNPGNPKQVIKRFFLISLSGFLINSALLATLLQLDIISTRLSSVISVVIIPIFTFAASKLWGFKNN